MVSRWAVVLVLGGIPAMAACGGDGATRPSGGRDAVASIAVGVPKGAVLDQDGRHPIPVTITLSRIDGATAFVSLRVCLGQRENPLDGGAGGASPHCAGVTRAQNPVTLQLNTTPTTWSDASPPTIAYRYVHAVLYPGDVIFGPLGNVFAPPVPLHTQTVEWPISLVPLPR